MHDSQQKIRDLEAISRRLNKKILEIPKLKEEISLLIDVKNENNKLLLDINRYKIKMNTIPQLKKKINTSNHEINEYKITISKLEDTIDSLQIKTNNEMPQLKNEIQRLTKINNEMDVNNIQLKSLLDTKERELAEMRAYQSQLSGTASRWLGLDNQSELSSSSLSPSKLEGMPSSLVEFMAKVAASPTSSTSSSPISNSSPSSLMMHPTSPSSSPSTPQAAHQILQKWVGGDTGSPSSQMGTPRRISLDNGSSSSTKKGSRTTTMSTILKNEGNATKLALRLARLEEQNRTLLHDRKSIDQISKDKINSLELNVKSLNDIITTNEKKIITLNNENDKLNRTIKDMSNTLLRTKTSNETIMERKKIEITSLTNTLKDTNNLLNEKKDEINNLKENITIMKSEHRSTLLTMQTEYDQLDNEHRSTLGSLQVFEETETHKREQMESSLKRKSDEVLRLRNDLRNVQDTLAKNEMNTEQERNELEKVIKHSKEELIVLRTSLQENKVRNDKIIRGKDRLLNQLNDEKSDIQVILDDERIKYANNMNNMNKMKMEQSQTIQQLEDETSTYKKELTNLKNSHIEHVEQIRRQHTAATGAMESEIKRLNVNIDRLKDETKVLSENMRKEQQRVRQLQSANACHVRSSEQLEEDLENMRSHVESENAASARWSELVQEATRLKFQAVQELDEYKKSTMEEKAILRAENEKKEHLNVTYKNDILIEKNNNKNLSTSINNLNDKINNITTKLQKVMKEKDIIETSLHQIKVERDTTKMTSMTLEKTLKRYQNETKDEVNRLLNIINEMKTNE